jgi:hypothetical protein
LDETDRMLDMEVLADERMKVLPSKTMFSVLFKRHQRNGNGYFA